MEHVVGYGVTLLAALCVLPAHALTLQAGPNTVPAGMRSSIPVCKSRDLSLGTDAENGNFDGMSHSGTLLVLRNLSPAACRVPARPEIGFVDNAGPGASGAGGVLPIKLEVPGARFMHPGPVMVAVVIAPGAEVTSKLRWVSGEVYENSVCLTPSAITVTIQGEVQQAGLSVRICGDKAKGVTFEATPLMPDPPLKP